MNMSEIFNFIKKSPNPQQFMMNMIQEKAGSNPIFGNILSLIQQGKTSEIESIARNLCKEKGLDFDTEFNNFKQSLGVK